MKIQSTRIDVSRFDRPNAGALQKLTMAQDGSTIDENYLNQKIMYLNQERQRIHDMAAKYGLVNNVKVPQLQLIQGGFNNQAFPSRESLAQIKDPKDRINEYHHRVNLKRKRIHEKQKLKLKEEAELEKKVLKQGGGALSKTKLPTTDEEYKDKPSKKKKNKIAVADNS